MKFFRIIIAAAFLAVSACATQHAEHSTISGPSASPTTGDESQDRSRARIHTELAASYFNVGNIGVALEEVKEALRTDVNYGPAYNVAGLIYARLKEDRMADESFQRALRINPNDHDANNNYGEFLCQRKQEKESIRYFLAAVRNPLYQFPDRSYVNAGVCARRGGDTAGAEEYFQTALKTRPGQPQALYQLAEMAYIRGDFGSARAYLNRLSDLGVDNSEVLWLGVRVVRKMGDSNAEASYARQLTNKFPDSREARALIAGQYE
jgi:type IV pilus assembly protein PilF